MSTPKKTHGLGRGLTQLIAGGATGASGKNATTAKNTGGGGGGGGGSTGGGATSAPAAKPVPAAHATPPAAAFPFQEIPVSKIVPAKRQARREFDEQSLAELADSIQEQGLLQPVVVRKTAEGYELIAGERRWRAFQKLALKNIPARIVEARDADAATKGLIENLQRENLNPVDEALGLASLMKDFNLTQETVAERVGKPRASVANSVRLLSLDREILGYLTKGMLTAGHAKVLLSLDADSDRLIAARRIIESGASVRAAEALVKKLRAAKPRDAAGSAAGGAGVTDTRTAAEVTAAIGDIERRLTSELKTKVSVKHGARLGKIVIEYYGNDDLRRILEKLGAAA
ncbi:MAG: ParB/RepB/Spo0J family partition protein [Puniceicoccales bacterium]|jgi:ParB family chromosome partitioning protein|nr:ParB/RepB/Spo0J family partition protein [Puniceicoccales bacterium]